jgi:1-aminocyclopropane-1-carboxylate deaminase/D-cysteine desulfhydrase-like pyridoxal-dependent ACC family enzyme
VKPHASRPLPPENITAAESRGGIITQRLHHPLLDDAGVVLYIQREDLYDPITGGNKWRKLKYNLQQARNEGRHTILTFGGAWSNHIAATAKACRLAGFNAIGIIRGEPAHGLTPTLAFAQENGMQIEFIDRQRYRDRHQAAFIDALRHRYGDVYLVPEGGSNALALKGCAEMVDDITPEFDLVAVACGTGATLAGIVTALAPGQQAVGFAVLKNGDFLNQEIQRMLESGGHGKPGNWQIETGYAFGGYARTSDALFGFIQQFRLDHGIMLDAVYTGKLFYGLFDQVRCGCFAAGTRIVGIHTGGLQGNAGFQSALETPQNSHQTETEAP